MDSKNGFAIVLIVILIAIIAAIGGTFYFNTQKSSPTSFIDTNQKTILQEFKKTTQLKFKKVSEEKLLFTGGYADPTVAKLTDGTLVLYVNKFGQGSVYKAYTSSDGLTWTEKTGTNLPNASTGRAVNFGDKIRFYYPGLMPIKDSDPPASIFNSISTDGFNFSKESGERVTPKAGFYLEGPTVIKISNDKYRMYFNENETASKEKRKGKIYGATSSDGLSWVRDDEPTIESDQKVENAPSDWPQALHPFVLKRQNGEFIMFYNTHSKIYAATSIDGTNWTKVGYTGIEGADADGYYLPDGTLRLYYGNFSPQTSGVVYTIDLREEYR